MRVGIAADHGGFEMKEQLAKKLAAEGHEGALDRSFGKNA
jgi:ribose 5-phosphate isomerase RpiB